MGNSTIQIPSDPAARKKLGDGIKEIVNSLTRIQGERTYIKEALNELSEEYEIEKKYLTRMAKEAFNDEFNEKRQENEDYSDLYEAVMIGSDDDEDEDEDDE